MSSTYISRTKGIPLLRCITISPSVLFEDERLLAIAKPPGIPSIAQSGSARSSLQDWLAEVYPALTELPECGLLQRLDTSTSGVLLAAKQAEIYEKLRELFRGSKVQKEYIALVEGPAPTPQRLEHFIGGRYRRSRKVTVRTEPKERFKRAVSEVETAAALPPLKLSIVRVSTETGVRHQVRAQLGAIGSPLAGDTLYGAKGKLPEIPLEPFGQAERDFFLHARRLSIPEGCIGVPCEFDSPCTINGIDA